MKLYWKTLILRRGETLAIHPTLRCSENCDYCPRLMINGKIRESRISNLNEWQIFIDEFCSSHKIREINISGGEPTLYPQLIELSNWVLGRGYHLVIYSNLFDETKFLYIRPSYRFKIIATFHHSMNADDFLMKYYILKDLHQIDVDEIDDGRPKTFPFSRLKPKWNKSDFEKYGSGWRIDPARKIFNSCLNMMENKNETQTEKDIINGSSN